VEDCSGDIKLNLGCGKMRWEGWINIDFEHGDVVSDLRHLDLPSGYANAAAAIHVIEHFYYWEIPAILQEWYRVLKPGGKLILELPCMDKVIGYMHSMIKCRQPFSPGMTWFALWGDPKYEDPLMVHKWGYTRDMLTKLVTDAGFANAEIMEPRYHFPIRDMRLEAVKPC
jgi:SAM-dependent methyltransferase